MKNFFKYFVIVNLFFLIFFYRKQTKASPTPTGIECLPPYWCADQGQDCPPTCPQVTNARSGACANGGKCCQQCPSKTCSNTGTQTFNICQGGATSTKVSWSTSNCSSYAICWCWNSIIEEKLDDDDLAICCKNNGFWSWKQQGITSTNYTLTNLQAGRKYTTFVYSYRGGEAASQAQRADFTQICPTATPTPIRTPTPTRTPIPLQTNTPTPTTQNHHSQGDANGDGVIDDKDFDDTTCNVSETNPSCWLKAYGKTGTGLKADFNNDNKVDLKDFEIWRSNAKH